MAMNKNFQFLIGFMKKLFTPVSASKPACALCPSRTMEACCIACGNPAYPQCKASCPIFDD